MAGSITVSSITLDSDNNFSIKSNTGATLFFANTSGVDIANSIGATTITSDKILSIANTKISGNIISSQIASVNGSVITANTIANSAIQTGAVENYMNAQGLGFGMRNRIINGAMVIDQRNAGATGTSNGVYTVDRWNFGSGVAGKMTYGQNRGSLTPPAGFTNYFGFITTTAYTVGASEFFLFTQEIEGFNVADFDLGKATAKTFTLSFYVNSTLTGTFGGVLSNSAQNRSFPFTYTINTASTWEQKTVTVVGDTTGTWLTTNGKGLSLLFGLGVGSTFNGTATGAWQAALYLGATGATSVVGTLNATWNITGVQLEKGSTATSFDYRPYGTELNLCLRYFQKLGSAVGVAATSAEFTTATQFFVPMRTSPTLSASAAMSVTDTNTADFTQSSAQVSIVTGTRINTLGVNYSCSNFSGMTANKVYITIPVLYSNGIILASAEL